MKASATILSAILCFLLVQPLLSHEEVKQCMQQTACCKLCTKQGNHEGKAQKDKDCTDTCNQFMNSVCFSAYLVEKSILPSVTFKLLKAQLLWMDDKRVISNVLDFFQPPEIRNKIT